jgi:CBS domain containing-hemolysin-like protein
MTVGRQAMARRGARRTRAARHASALGAVAGALLAPVARASFLSGDALDTAADWLAIFILIFVPIGAIVLFWLVHILPEKVAEKRHHPQRDAITTLCLLSLVFGGLLWPIAWLWAYTRPIGYKMAYGTEKHEDYFTEMGERAKSGALVEHDVAHLRDELDAMAKKGTLPPHLRQLRAELDALGAPAADAGAATRVAKDAG